jgi:hypothetical protein
LHAATSALETAASRPAVVLGPAKREGLVYLAGRACARPIWQTSRRLC